MLINGDLKELTDSSSDNVAEQQYTSLRDRIVALILRKTRMEQDKPLETIAAQCELEPEELEQFENGSSPVPLPILEILCAEYQIPVLSLTSQKPSSKPSPSAEVTSTQSNENLPEEVAEFVNNPANLPYLELARKLSDLDAAKLRSIAEGLLEITY
jgi:transcriptional regulator with XRE-family HTH domain